MLRQLFSFFFFFNDTATTEIYTLSLHDALPIFQFFEVPFSKLAMQIADDARMRKLLSNMIYVGVVAELLGIDRDRKSTRLNSSHSQISYAVFCLKKKKTLVIAPYLPYDSYPRAS